MSSLANGWVESYLDALLSFGLSSEHANTPGNPRDDLNADRNLHAKYYLNQILGMNEGGLWQAWSKAKSAKSPAEKDSRLEYLSWRVWFMKQNNVKVEVEEAKRQEEEVLTGAFVSGSDSDDDDAHGPATSGTPKMPMTLDDSFLDKHDSLTEVGSGEQPVEGVDSFENRVDKLYITLISMHGLVRGDRMELGRDPDTGGQVKYVVELARALSEHPAVHRVDLLTRMIKAPGVDPIYGEAEECIKRGEGKMGGAYIVRVPCGPVRKYIRKEELWPHVREFADHGIAHCKNMLESLSHSGEPCELYVIHGHYSDAGEAAALMGQTLGVDMVLTGHSLGRNKLEHLIASKTLTLQAVDKTYNINRRIEGEERALDESIMVFTSTQQEVKEQWGLYDGYNSKLEEIVRRRKKGGLHVPTMRVIPPGLDFSSLKMEPPKKNSQNNVQGEPGTPKVDGVQELPAIGRQEDPRIWQQVARFLQNPRKPVILAMSRPDAKKNIKTLVTAYGNNNMLKELANLVLIMGNRDIIDSMAKSSKDVLEEVLKLIDAYDLYGSVAYPKFHKQTEISDIYSLPAATGGVFVNIALQEPFGLTLIEAAGHGVPIVATQNGGPVDIISTLKNGKLVDPTNEEQIVDALLHCLTDKQVWTEFSQNGLNNIMAYAWPSHCWKYLENIEKEKKRRKTTKQITAFSGSWDNSKFNAMVDDAGGEMKSADEFGNPMDSLMLSQHETPKLVDDTALEFDPEGRMAEEERDAGQPRVAKRGRVCVFTLDNQQMARQALDLLKSAIKNAYGEDSENRLESPQGFGLNSMLSFDATCALLDYGEVDLQDLDFIIANSGADLFVWWGHEDMTSYEPYDIHIDNNWNKQDVQRSLERIRKEGKKDNKLLKYVQKKTPFGMSSETGPFHILMEIEKESVMVDDVAVVDRIRKKLRSNGIRAHTILQVDKTRAGKQVAPLLHVTPLRATRALAMRFLFHRLGVDMGDVVVICFASSVSKLEPRSGQEQESRKVGFVVSDTYDVVGGKQKVVIVPPTDETRVRVPTDRLDEQMIEKLRVPCGPDIYEDRVVLLEEKTKFAHIAEYLTEKN